MHNLELQRAYNTPDRIAGYVQDWILPELNDSRYLRSHLHCPDHFHKDAVRAVKRHIEEVREYYVDCYELEDMEAWLTASGYPFEPNNAEDIHEQFQYYYALEQVEQMIEDTIAYYDLEV